MNQIAATIATTMEGLTYGKIFQTLCITALLRFWYLVILRQYPVVTAFKYSIITFAASALYYEPLSKAVEFLYPHKDILDLHHTYHGLIADIQIASKFRPSPDALSNSIKTTYLYAGDFIEYLKRQMTWNTWVGQLANFVVYVFKPLVDTVVALDNTGGIRKVIQIDTLIRFAKLFEDTITIDGFLQAWSFGYFIRIKKDQIPYFIRWHLGHALYFGLIGEYSYVRVFSNAKFIIARLTARQDIEGVKLIEGILALLSVYILSLLIWMMLHAAFGQYFFLPLLTETVEMHTSRRPIMSPYSGGYASWQKVNREDYGLFQWWWGIFGKDKEDIELNKAKRKKKKDNKKKPK